MNWHDAESDAGGRDLGRPGGDWQGMRPVFDNPMTWAVPLGRLFGVRIRLHVIFVIFIVVAMLRSTTTPKSSVMPLDEGLTALVLGCLLLVVFLHEVGHCLACRLAKGEADEILMWPLGGLAFCRPPRRWSAHLLTGLGGLIANGAIAAVTIPLTGLLTGVWIGAALPNPLHPPIDHLTNWWMLILGFIHWTNIVVLLANLIPMFPLDGGRIVQAVLWRRLGYRDSMRLAVHVGFVAAILMAVSGAIPGNWIMVVIAVAGGLTCYLTHRQVKFTDEILGDAGDDVDDEDSAAAEAARRAADEAARVDAILAKIADQGIRSLTGRERRLLKRTTERQQRQ